MWEGEGMIWTTTKEKGNRGYMEKGEAKKREQKISKCTKHIKQSAI